MLDLIVCIYELQHLFTQGAVMLPMMFSHDFEDQIQQYATLVDPKNNQFEILVERNNQGIYLTMG